MIIRQAVPSLDRLVGFHYTSNLIIKTFGIGINLWRTTGSLVEPARKINTSCWATHSTTMTKTKLLPRCLEWTPKSTRTSSSRGSSRRSSTLTSTTKSTVLWTTTQMSNIVCIQTRSQRTRKPSSVTAGRVWSQRSICRSILSSAKPCSKKGTRSLLRRL